MKTITKYTTYFVIVAAGLLLTTPQQASANHGSIEPSFSINLTWNSDSGYHRKSRKVYVKDHMDRHGQYRVSTRPVIVYAKTPGCKVGHYRYKHGHKHSRGKYRHPVFHRW